MYQLFPLTEVPQRNKFDYFGALVDRIFCPMHNEPNPVSTAPFDAQIELAKLGSISLAQVTTSPVIVHRRKRDISRMCDAPYLIKFQLQGEALWSQRNRDVHLRPGDFVICSTSEPYQLRFDGPYKMPVLAIEEPIMRQLTSDPDQFLGRRMAGDDVACGLLSSFVAQVVQRMSSLPEPMVERIETNILDLLGGVLNAHAQDAATVTTRENRVGRMKAFIRDNLRDRRLGPTRVANAFGVSTRYVHKVFAAEAQTVNRYIQSMRLKACYQSLTDPRFARRSITDIAVYWGFYDLPHMTRCFKKAFGEPPRAVRARYLEGRVPPAH